VVKFKFYPTVLNQHAKQTHKYSLQSNTRRTKLENSIHFEENNEEMFDLIKNAMQCIQQFINELGLTLLCNCVVFKHCRNRNCKSMRSNKLYLSSVEFLLTQLGNTSDAIFKYGSHFDLIRKFLFCTMCNIY